MRRFLAILHARNIEFVRDRTALAWNIALPVLLLFGFYFLFSNGDRDIYKVGIYGDASSSQLSFLQTRYIDFVAVKDLEKAIDRVKHHGLDMLIDLTHNNRYWINTSSPKGYVVERMLKGSENHSAQYQRQTVQGREIRYVDWVLPGILGMNMMFSCLFGIGYVIVRYRKNGVLKRLKATPLTALEFLSAQILSRLLITMLITVVVFVGCDIFINFYMLGSYWTLLLVFTLGSLCLISLGLLMATRTVSEEFAGGILNLVTWPMMILSGVWFSLDGASPFMRGIAQILPLTHIIDAARAVMNDGAGLTDIYGQLLFLVITTVVFLFAGSALFKWE